MAIVDFAGNANSGGGGGGGAANAVLYTQQSLTDEQKTQARTNIGAGTYTKSSSGIPKSDLASGVKTSLGKADGAVRFDTSQSLSSNEKSVACDNIGALCSTASTGYKAGQTYIEDITQDPYVNGPKEGDIWQRLPVWTTISPTYTESEYWGETTRVYDISSFSSSRRIKCQCLSDGISYVNANNETVYIGFQQDGYILPVGAKSVTISVEGGSAEGEFWQEANPGRICEFYDGQWHDRVYLSGNYPTLASGISSLKIWKGTQADYNLLTPNNDTIYFIQ